MPNVYANPAAYGLELFGEIRELHVYENVFMHAFHVAVWRELATGHLYYGIDVNRDMRPGHIAFAGVERLDQLTWMLKREDFEKFRQELNDYWRRRPMPAHLLSYSEKQYRNARKRLQHKVGRWFFRNADAWWNQTDDEPADSPSA